MSGNLWMFSDMLDDEDIEMQKHDFITLYQGADYYGLGLKSFTRMAREAGAVYKIGKKVLIRRTIFDEYLRKIYKKEMEQKALDDAEKDLVMRQGTMVTDEESGRMDIRFYQMLTQNSEGQLIAKFNKLPLDHPARAPFNLFAQSSDTVKSGIILGLGTRLQS